MKFSSKLFACGVLAVVAIAGAVQASSYYNQHSSNSYGNNNNYQKYQPAASHPSSSCGYDCRNSPAYGPYHSYAVRPAIYGGHGMYHYRGYARQPLPPAHANYRVVRSYAPSSYSAPASHYGGGSNNYAMRPVKALVLAPAYSGNGGHHYSAPASYGGYGSNGHASYQPAAPKHAYQPSQGHYQAPAQSYHQAPAPAQSYHQAPAPAQSYHQAPRHYGNNYDAPAHHASNNYAAPAQYGNKYEAAPAQYGNKYEAAPAQYGNKYEAAPAQYGNKYEAAPARYGNNEAPAHYGSNNNNYNAAPRYQHQASHY